MINPLTCDLEVLSIDQLIDEVIWPLRRVILAQQTPIAAIRLAFSLTPRYAKLLHRLLSEESVAAPALTAELGITDGSLKVYMSELASELAECGVDYPYMSFKANGVRYYSIKSSCRDRVATLLQASSKTQGAQPHISHNKEGEVTIIPKHFHSEDMPVHVRFRPAACRDCGAKNLEEAGNICRPQSCQSGEYFCDGSEGDIYLVTSWDKRGVGCRPTNKEQAKEARAFEAYMRSQCDMGCGKAVMNCQCTHEMWRAWHEKNELS